jgi:hypothetical protein
LGLKFQCSPQKGMAAAAVSARLPPLFSSPLLAGLKSHLPLHGRHPSWRSTLIWYMLPHTSWYMLPHTSWYMLPHTSWYMLPHTSWYMLPHTSSLSRSGMVRFDCTASCLFRKLLQFQFLIQFLRTLLLKFLMQNLR